MYYETSRLIIKEFLENDAELLYHLLSDDNIMKYAYHDKFSKKDFEIRFNKILEESKKTDDRKEYDFAVFEKESNDFIGYALIEIYQKNNLGGYGEIGYFLLENFWGNGYATEIANTLIDICFNEIKLHKAVASCNEYNPSSENVMKKIGMKKEGTMRKERYKNGMWMDELRYGILKDEWENR